MTSLSFLLLVFYLAVILFSAIIAFVSGKSLRDRKLIIFVPYLFYVFIQELTLVILDSFSVITSNELVYNFYRVLTVFVFGYVYYSIPIMKPVKKFILWTVFLYFLAFIIIYSFFSSIPNARGYLVVVRSIIISTFAILFLLRYFHLDNRKEEKFWMPVVWVTVGAIIFYPVTGISLGFQKYLADNNTTFAGLKLYQLIPQILSIFMYGCFGYAFYLCKKKS